MKALRLCAILAVLQLLAASVTAQNPDEIKKIDKALPAKARVKPAKTRTVLIFNLCKGFKHSSVPYCDKALTMLGEKTGAYRAVSSTDVNVFKPESLKQFDAVVMNNTTGEILTDQELRKSLLDFVKQGKGLIGVHAATDCCYQWQEYGELIGGYFSGHPWTADTTVTVKIDEPDHPVVAAFKGKDFVVQDEIYQFRDPYSRSKLRVLASINTKKTDMTRKGINRVDNDFAISWIRPYEKGRVFYCSLGHNHEIFWTPAILQHYLDGIQYALGDLEADSKPLKSVAGAIAARSMSDLLTKMARYDFDGSDDHSAGLHALVGQMAQSPEGTRTAARKMAAFAAGTDRKLSATLAARQLVCNELASIAGDEDASVLAPLLASRDVRITDMARSALERLPGKRASQILRDAAARSSGNARIGIINSIAARCSAEAVPALVKILEGLKAETARQMSTVESLGLDEEAPAIQSVRKLVLSMENTTARAVLHALGCIATPQAGQALEKLAPKCPTELQPAFTDAWLVMADQLLKQQNSEKAAAIYRRIYNSSSPFQARIPAFVGLVHSATPDSQELVLNALLGNEPTLQSAAAGLVLRMPGTDLTARLVQRASNASTSTQVMVLRILGSRADSSAMAFAKQKAKDPDLHVRIEALKALAIIGDGSVIQLLAQAAASANTEERDTARTSLVNLRTKDADPSLLKSLAQSLPNEKKGSARIQRELIKAVLGRKMRQGVPELLKAAAARDASVRTEAFGALAELAKSSDLPALTGLLLKETSDNSRKAAEKAVASAARTVADENSRSDAVVSALPAATTADTSASIIRVLGQIGGKGALSALRSLRKESHDETVQDAVVRALASFPSVDAIQDNLQIATESSSTIHRVLALRGFSHMMAMPSDRPSTETVAFCRQALQLATRAEDKKMVVGEIAGVGQPEALDLILPYLNDPELKDEAVAACIKLGEAVYTYAPGDTKAAMEKVLANVSDEDRRKDVKKVINQINKVAGRIMVWELSGPYPEKGECEYQELLDKQFAPEQVAGKAVWKLVRSGSDRKKPEFLDLRKRIGGQKRAAYLRLRLWSPEARRARLEMGSDDGIKVWLNGKVVHSSYAERGYEFGVDKADVDLTQGWNYLMVKVVQNKSEWGLGVRVANSSGDEMDDIRIDTSEVENTNLFIAGVPEKK